MTSTAEKGRWLVTLSGNSVWCFQPTTIYHHHRDHRRLGVAADKLSECFSFTQRSSAYLLPPPWELIRERGHPDLLLPALQAAPGKRELQQPQLSSQWIWQAHNRHQTSPCSSLLPWCFSRDQHHHWNIPEVFIKSTKITVLIRMGIECEETLSNEIRSSGNLSINNACVL